MRNFSCWHDYICWHWQIFQKCRRHARRKLLVRTGTTSSSLLFNVDVFYLKAKSASEIEIGENKNYNFRCYKSWNVKRAPRRNYKQHRICAIVSFIHSCVSIPFGTAGNGGKLWIMNSTNFLLVFIARAFSSDNRIFAL